MIAVDFSRNSTTFSRLVCVDLATVPPLVFRTAKHRQNEPARWAASVSTGIYTNVVEHERQKRHTNIQKMKKNEKKTSLQPI